MTKPQPFFELDNDFYIGNPSAGGPWSESACHAGPPSAAIAREFEKLTDKQLVRITLNLLRPIPMSGFRIEARISKEGRNTAYATATLIDDEQKVCARSEALYHRLDCLDEFPKSGADKLSYDPVLTYLREGKQSVVAVKGRKMLPTGGFCQAVETLAPENTAISIEEGAISGTTAEIWMRTPQLIDGEALSGFQKTCPIADCINGVSTNIDIQKYLFMNTDLTVALHRIPTDHSEWIGLKAKSDCHTNGLAICNGVLFDQQGAIGFALQNILLRQR